MNPKALLCLLLGVCLALLPLAALAQGMAYSAFIKKMEAAPDPETLSKTFHGAVTESIKTWGTDMGISPELLTTQTDTLEILGPFPHYQPVNRYSGKGRAALVQDMDQVKWICFVRLGDRPYCVFETDLQGNMVSVSGGLDAQGSLEALEKARTLGEGDPIYFTYDGDRFLLTSRDALICVPTPLQYEKKYKITEKTFDDLVAVTDITRIDPKVLESIHPGKLPLGASGVFTYLYENGVPQPLDLGTPWIIPLLWIAPAVLIVGGLILWGRKKDPA